MIPPTIPRVDEIRLDGTVLGFGLFITIACGLFFGMAPATRGARANLLSTLTQSGRGVLGSSRELWRHGLVVAQTGFATMLVVLAALLLQSLVRLQQVPLGFEPSGVMTTRLSVPQCEVSGRGRNARVPSDAARIARVAAVGSGSRSHDERAIRPRGSPRGSAARPCGGPRLVGCADICR